jgi:hypothetical protein
MNIESMRMEKKPAKSMSLPGTLCRELSRSARGAVLVEYLIGVSAVAMITLGAVIPLFTEVRDSYQEFAEIVKAPPVFIIRRDGMVYSEAPEEDTSDPTNWVSDDPDSEPEPSPEPDPEPDPEPTPDPEEDDGVCPAWIDFGYGFVQTQTMVQIHVPGKIIGVHGTNGNVKKKKSSSINLDDVEELGDEFTTFVLGIEYDGIHEYFTDHNRISVFSLDGEKIINRALVKYEETGDIRQGDEYIIAHTQDLIIDLTGSLYGDRQFDEETQAGDQDFGNNDSFLSFHDIGCVIYRPE